MEKSGHRGRNFNQELGKASSLVEIPIMGEIWSFYIYMMDYV